MTADTSLERRVFDLLLLAENLRTGGQPDQRVANLVADAIEAHLLRKTPLDSALGIRAKRGSHRTAQAVAESLIADERA